MQRRVERTSAKARLGSGEYEGEQGRVVSGTDGSTIIMSAELKPTWLKRCPCHNVHHGRSELIWKMLRWSHWKMIPFLRGILER